MRATAEGVQQAPSAAAAKSAPKPAPVRRKEPPHPRAEEGLAPQIWVAGLIAIVIILLIVFGMTL